MSISVYKYFVGCYYGAVSEEKRGRGRPRKYPKDLANDGAPVLSVRLNPDVYLFIQARPEGSRAYIEQLVRNDDDFPKAAPPDPGQRSKH